MIKKLAYTIFIILLLNSANAQAPFDINGYWQQSEANTNNIVQANGSITYKKIAGANDDIRSCQSMLYVMPNSFKFSFNFSVSQVNYEGAALIPIAFTAGNIPISNPDKNPGAQTYQDALGIIFQTPLKNNKDLRLSVYLKQKDKPFTNLYAEFVKINYNQIYNVVLQRCSATKGVFSVSQNGKLIGKNTFTIPSNFSSLKYIQASNMVQASAQRGCNAFANKFEYTTNVDELCNGKMPEVKPEIINNENTETPINVEPTIPNTTTQNTNIGTIKVGNRVFTNPNPNSTGGCCIMQTGSINNYIGGIPDLEANYNEACFQHNTLNYSFPNGVKLTNGFAKWTGPDDAVITEYTNNIPTKKIVFDKSDMERMHYKKETYLDLGNGTNKDLIKTIYTIEYFYSKKNYRPDSAIGYNGNDKLNGYQTIIFTYKKDNVIAATLKNSFDGSIQNYKVELDKNKYNRLHLSFRINYFVGLQTFTNPNLLFTINGFSKDQVNDIVPTENVGNAKAYHFDYTYIKENVKTYITNIRGSNGMKLDFTYECQKLKLINPIIKTPKIELPTETPPIKGTDNQPPIKETGNPKTDTPIKILPPPIKVVPVVKDTTPKTYANLLVTDKEKLLAGKWKRVSEYQTDYHFDYDNKADSIKVVPLVYCLEDDFIEFRTDFTIGEVLGKTPCPSVTFENERNTKSGKWSIKEDDGLGQGVTFYFEHLALKGNYRLIKLTQNEFEFSICSSSYLDKNKNRKIYRCTTFKFIR